MYAESWHLSGGGVEIGESLAEAARRELSEEAIGLPEAGRQLEPLPWLTGSGAATKTLDDGSRVWCNMQFNYFRYISQRSASQLIGLIRPGSDFIELQFFAPQDLAHLPTVPGGIEEKLISGELTVNSGPPPTTLLLHGGRLRNPDPRNPAYFRELTRGLQDGDEVLFIGFARRDEADRLKQYHTETAWITAQAPARVTVVNASHAQLIDQIRSAKAVHITGGQTDKLVADIRQYPDFLAALPGKVVGGSSAGAALFAAYYYYGPTRSIQAGLGALPIRLLVHAGSEEFHSGPKALQLIESVHAELELIVLEEGEWVSRKAVLAI